jgi:bifunctional non-homologous end joining protein LigD
MEPHVGLGVFGQTKTRTVSTPVTWQEVERGVRTEDFTMMNVPRRLKKRGDLWEPLLHENGRVRLERFL